MRLGNTHVFNVAMSVLLVVSRVPALHGVVVKEGATPPLRIGLACHRAVASTERTPGRAPVRAA
ncbi:hypothetical protein [Burkholderia vietnamiensis]|uniref:hypothetical protein n=1 Tax=Burkholderia vietnamiensis TaxID=60552 RepID=UPI000A7F99BE|nr:hypothetical protein [Burkholderia vietnamiensis]MBR8360414.1 hypothetical protein [Burkholderia vietnamiensis]HDR8963259.1 hypothetical protein [Burkholderia vietnamiensis]HDR9360313.1 hypothetical protein [Burkholderia vietnamiensis]